MKAGDWVTVEPGNEDDVAQHMGVPVESLPRFLKIEAGGAFRNTVYLEDRAYPQCGTYCFRLREANFLKAVEDAIQQSEQD